MSHRHFSRNERIQLAGFEKAGMKKKDMAAALGKHPSKDYMENMHTAGRKQEKCVQKYVQ